MSLKKFWVDFKKVFLVFVIWRILLLLAENIGMSFVPFKESFPFIEIMLKPSGFPQWVWQWGNFDGVHYLFLASHSYTFDGMHVFFPLYPLLIKTLTFITGNYLFSGLLISHIAILFAAVVLYRLSKSFWSVIFLFAFPTAFYFGSVYTESLFILLILLSFYIKSRWKYLTSFLAGTTKLVGISLGSTAVLGLGTYISYLAVVWHRPLAFIESQSAFKNARASSLTTLITPPQVIWRYMKIFSTANPANLDYWLAVLEFTAFSFGVGFLIWVFLKKKFPLNWQIFSWAALLMPTFSGTFSSMPRYLLVIFPIYIMLGNIKNTYLKCTLAIIFVILQLLLTTLFTRGYFVS